MNWYIGQKIICVKTHSWGVVKKGQVFIIKGLSESICTCYAVLIHVGLTIETTSRACGMCGIVGTFTDNTYWLGEVLFAPIKDEEIGNTTTEEILEEIESQELVTL